MRPRAGRASRLGDSVARPNRLEHVPLLRGAADVPLEHAGDGLGDPMHVGAERSRPCGVDRRRDDAGVVTPRPAVDHSRQQGRPGPQGQRRRARPAASWARRRNGPPPRFRRCPGRRGARPAGPHRALGAGPRWPRLRAARWSVPSPHAVAPATRTAQAAPPARRPWSWESHRPPGRSRPTPSCPRGEGP